MRTAMEQTITSMPPALQRTILTIGCAAADVRSRALLVIISIDAQSPQTLASPTRLGPRIS